MKYVEHDEYLTVLEAQNLLKISKSLMLHLIHNEDVPASRVGTKQWRIRKSDLIEYMENQKSY